MAVKMRKWSPWPPAAATRKFEVAVKPLLKLEGSPAPEELHGGGEESDTAQKLVAIKIKWKGEPNFFQRYSNQRKEISREKVLKKGQNIIRWDEDEWFRNTCRLPVVSDDDRKFGSWVVAFNVICGDSKAKMAVIGRVSMNIAEIAWSMDNPSVEQNLPLNLAIDGVSRNATLTVLVNLVEIREDQGSVAITRNCSTKGLEYNGNIKGRRRSLSHEDVSLDELDVSAAREVKDAAQASVYTRSSSSAVSGTQLDSDKKKEGWFSWKSKGFSFKRAKTKEEKLDEKAQGCSHVNRTDADPQCTASSLMDQKDDNLKPGLEPEDNEEASTTGAWEEKELISRDGHTTLKASVFFASFDQRSDKAAGESACTALVAVISHWLHSNTNAMPNRPEFDNLILQGSSEWRKLCQDSSYVKNFPNKHFDLETVLRVDIRPVSISHDKSFVGFFGAEKFQSLKGAMSFDDIWNEISRNAAGDERIYIVSWNDHFFVLKAEAGAYYIIDTLGERLHEGCNQAYILRFDDSAVMRRHSEKEKPENASSEDLLKEEEEIICSGRECCREYIKRFLAAIPLKELEEEEKKDVVSYFSLHHRLQIEFNYSCTSSPASSLTSSPFSSVATPKSSSSPTKQSDDTQT